jgi:energy-coupling factor transporter ATP-binding protein EcfA2
LDGFDNERHGMEIELQERYLSLSPFTAQDLPDFVVLTGKNGSGKSQLLESILGRYQNMPKALVSDQGVVLSNVISNSLYGNSKKEWKGSQWAETAKELFSLYKYGYLYYLSAENRINVTCLRDEEEVAFLTKYKLLSSSAQNEVANDINSAVQKIKEYLKQPNDTVSASFASFVNLIGAIESEINLFEEIAKRKNKAIIDLTESDFSSHPIHESHFFSESFFYQSIPDIFLPYAIRRQKNLQDYLWAQHHGIESSSIRDEEFLEKYPAPWSVLNSVLEKCSLKYRFREIDNITFSPEENFNVDLYDVRTGTKVDIENLSTGEAKILSLCLIQFQKGTYEGVWEFPDVLLLDEADSFLAPEYVKLLIDVLLDVFVKDLGIRVVLTTHSPTTVALSPEESIYSIVNYPETKINKINKDEALKTLTSFIPTLSIDYRNHRQVLVEGPVDRFYYQRLFEKISEHEKFDYQLYFISRDAAGKDNKASVIEGAKALRGAGVLTIFGIIDWDLEDNKYEGVFVHGKDSRYSLENFLFDPLNLGVFFLQHGFCSFNKELDLADTYNPYDLPNSTIEIRNRVRDFFLQKLSAAKKSIATNLNGPARTVTYYNGSELELPRWFLDTGQHQIEEAFKLAFPMVVQKFAGSSLHEQLTLTMCRCKKGIPIETFSLFKELAVFKN